MLLKSSLGGGLFRYSLHFEVLSGEKDNVTLFHFFAISKCMSGAEEKKRLITHF